MIGCCGILRMMLPDQNAVPSCFIVSLLSYRSGRLICWLICWCSNDINITQSQFSEQPSVCLSGLLPLSAHRAVLVSCRVRNLKGSRINKRKAKLQQAFGSHAGSGTLRAHKELTVSAAALRIPTVYSPRHTHTHHIHTDGTQKRLRWG